MNNSFFNGYPYTDFHELNLSWVIQELRSFATTLEQFVSINALKYADPIQWNITTQYEKNTIVIDPVTGVAYISVAPVPAGVIITNTDYWTPVFDLGELTEKTGRNIANKYEEATTLTATFPSDVNDWIIWGDVLYKVISPIVAGDQYVIDSNIVHFTLEDIIGHLEDLSTTDKTNLVAAINEVLTTLVNTTGDLDDLTTTDKTNLVAAINEIYAAFNLHRPTRVFYVREYGAVGDGVTDDTVAIQAAINASGGNGLILFDPVTYLISDTLTITNSMTVLSSYIQKDRELYPIIKANFTDKPVITIGDGTNWIEGCMIEHLNITRSSMGIVGSKTINVQKCLYTRINNSGVSLSQMGIYGQEINGLLITDCHITTGGDLGAGESVYGIYINGDGYDNSGLIVEGIVYFGFATPNSTKYVIYDKATQQTGDIQLIDVEAAGGINYGIYLDLGTGFANNIIIDRFTADSVYNNALYFIGRSLSPVAWQNLNISNIWANLDSTDCYGITFYNVSNICLENVCITSNDVPSATNLSGIMLYQCTNFNINNVTFDGYLTRLMVVDSCTAGNIDNITSKLDNAHLWISSSIKVMVSNCSLKGSIIGVTNTYCYKNNCIEDTLITGRSLRISEQPFFTSKGATHTLHTIDNALDINRALDWKVFNGQSAGTSITDNADGTATLTIGADEPNTLLIVSVADTLQPGAHDFLVIAAY